jgi:hypothetical protein
VRNRNTPISSERHKGRRYLSRLMRRRKDTIKVAIKETGGKIEKFVHWFQLRVHRRIPGNTNMNIQISKYTNNFFSS